MADLTHFDERGASRMVDTSDKPETLRQARASGYHILHKPVDPMTLRAMVSHVLREQQVARAH